MKDGLDSLGIKKAWRKVEEQLKSALNPFGARISDYHILLVAEKYESITISDIAEEGAMHISTVWNFAALLEEKGYLKFEKDGQDKRSTYVSITERGRKFLDVLKESVKNMQGVENEEM